MKTFEQIKYNFRIHQIGDTYYVQEKKWYGWSYDNYAEYSNDTTGWWTAYLVLSTISLVVGVVSFFLSVFAGVSIWVPISGFGLAIILFIVNKIINLTYKKFAIHDEGISDVEWRIDDIIKERIKAKTKKEEKRLERKAKREKRREHKEHKYHYFYDDKRMRAEKIKKLSHKWF
jgi:hypothetical protein